MAVHEDDTSLVAEILRAPLDQFVAVRSDTVRRLRADGDSERARRIASLRKPSTILWALNQAGRVAADDLDSLREAATRLRGAQEDVVAGRSGAASELRAAAQQQRERVDALSRRLGVLLSAAGHGAGTAATRSLADLLRTLSLSDDEQWQTFRDGALTAEPAPESFPMLDVRPLRRAEQPAAGHEDLTRQRRIDAAATAVQRAAAVMAAARDQLEIAEQRFEEAQDTLDEARAELQRASAQP